MRLTFLGGAQTVTGSRFLVDTGRARILVDCGMFQGSPDEVVRNRVPLGFDPAALDAIVLTHAHLDHCGLLPVVAKAGFGGPIIATDGTAELAAIVLLDSAKLQVEFAERARKRERRDPARAERDQRREMGAYTQALELARAGEGDEPHADPESALRAQPPDVRLELDEPLYLPDDAQAAIGLFRRQPYDEEREILPGVHVRLLDAGHILGSAIVQLRVADGSGSQGTTVVFSGDLGRPGTPIIRDPTPVPDADFLLVESTYGGREHEPSAQAVQMLADAVRDVARDRGVLLIPSFSIGRTQEIVWYLDRLLERGEIPHLPLYLDSPMASHASDIYRAHPDYFDAETADLLRREASPLDYPDQHVTAGVADSKAINDAARPHIVIASNGMLTGGRVLHHFRRIVGDPAGHVLFVGYQGEGTMGRHLLDGAKNVRLDGNEVDVRCRVSAIDGFSAHADESELLDWVGNFVRGRRPGDRGVPQRVFLVHGDPPAQAAMRPKVEAMGLPVDVPAWHVSVDLD